MAEYSLKINPGIQEATEVEFGIPLIDRLRDGTANTRRFTEKISGLLGISDMSDIEIAVADRALIARHHTTTPLNDEPISVSHRAYLAALEQMHSSRTLTTPVTLTKVTESIVPGETGQAPRPLEDSLVISSLRRNLWTVANSSSRSFDQRRSRGSHSPVSIQTLQIASSALYMAEQVMPAIWTELMASLQLQEMACQSFLSAETNPVDIDAPQTYAFSRTLTLEQASSKV